MTKSSQDIQKIKGENYIFREVTADDVEAVVDFALQLPPDDLLYINRDVTKKPVVEAWIHKAVEGEIRTIVVEKDNEIIGSSAVMIDKLSWSKHVGEIRVLVADEHRKNGIGRALVEKAFIAAAETGLRKVTAQMTIEQRDAIVMFEEMGFSGEALLKDHVETSSGEFTDLVVLSCDLSEAAGNLSLTS